MRRARIKTGVQLRNLGQDNSRVFFKSNIVSCRVSRIWKRLLDWFYSRIFVTAFSVLIGNSFLEGLVSIGKLLLPGKMHNTDVKTTAVLKTLVLLTGFQFVLPKYFDGLYPLCVNSVPDKWPASLQEGLISAEEEKITGNFKFFFF